MSTKTSLRRVVLFMCGVAVGLFLTSGVASAEPQKDNPNNTSPQPASKADFSGHGANHHGSYDSTRDGSPSGNGNGGGKAKGKPCAGCVGKADNKNPKGQYPDGSDHNKGYECDGNHGIGRSNPAHTGCRMESGSQPSGGDKPAVGDKPCKGDKPSAGDKPAVGDEPSAGDEPSVGGDTTPTVGPSTDSDKPVGTPDTEVEGASLERAASALTNAANPFVLAAGAIRGSALNTAAVKGVTVERGGITALPLTGAGIDVTTSVLVALALLSAGLVLVRRSRATA